MDMGKSVFGVLAIAIAVLIIGALAIPVIENVAIYEKEYRDNSQTALYNIDADDVTLAVTSNGATISGQTVTYGTYTILAVTDTIQVYSGSAVTGINVVYESNDLRVKLTLEAGDTVTIGSGAYTINDGGTNITGTYGSDLIVLDPNGSHVSNTNYMTTAYLANLGANIAISSLGNLNLAYLKMGTATEIASPNLEETGLVDGDFKWDASKTDGVYTVENVRWFSEGDSEGVAAYMFVPQEYYVLVESQDENTLTTLFSIIPLLLIVSVVMMAVRMYGSE